MCIYIYIYIYAPSASRPISEPKSPEGAEKGGCCEYIIINMII